MDIPPGLSIFLWVGLSGETLGTDLGSGMFLTNISERDQVALLQYHLSDLVQKLEKKKEQES
jgi:hypothetical protein